MKVRRIDRELERRSDAPDRRRVDARREPRVVLREEDLLVVRGVARLDADARRPDAEDDECVRAELLQHVDRHDDARQVRCGELAALEGLGTDSQRDALDTGRWAPRRVEADTELSEDCLLYTSDAADE